MFHIWGAVGEFSRLIKKMDQGGLDVAKARGARSNAESACSKGTLTRPKVVYYLHNLAPEVGAPKPLFAVFRKQMSFAGQKA